MKEKKNRKCSERFLSLAHNLPSTSYFFQLLGLILGPHFYFSISLSAFKCLRNPEAANLLPIPASSVCEKKNFLHSRERKRKRERLADSYRGKQF